MSATRVLRPGTPVLIRAPGVVQVGLDGPTALVADDVDVHRLLTALRRPGGAGPDLALSPAAARALDHLEDAGLLTPLGSADDAQDPVARTLRAQFGPDAVRRQQARATTGIAVRCDPQTRLLLDPLLSAAGLSAVTDRPAVQLVVVTGTLDREQLDPLVRDAVPHLVVAGSAVGRRIGPFVDPGHTACLRCVDAHESLRDERQSLLLAQAARQSATQAPPTDLVLDQLVLAWAVRDVARYVEGDEPSTWSATVDVEASGTPGITRWGRHPYCGCAWDAVLELP